MRAGARERRPYITHPVAVAASWRYRLDSASIVTALLHDVAEDTAVGLAEIERRFGREVARLVDGVTKLTRSSCSPSARSRRRTSASWCWRCRRTSASCS
jgi:(p)ppGpp synthase/HD superfamily hydrolase